MIDFTTLIYTQPGSHKAAHLRRSPNLSLRASYTLPLRVRPKKLRGF